MCPVLPLQWLSLKGKWLQALCNVPVMSGLKQIAELQQCLMPHYCTQRCGFCADIAQWSNWIAQVPLASKLWPYKLSRRLQMSSHEDTIQLQELWSCLHGECWVPVDVLYLQRPTQCSRRRLWALALFSFQETDLPESPGWQYWTQPCFGVSWVIKVKLFVTHLLAPERNEPGWGKAVCIHIHQSQQRGFHVCLKQLLCPLKKPSARSIRWAPCHASELCDESLLSTPGRKSTWVHLLGEFLPRSPYLAPAVPPWPAAAWQMHVTGC